MVNRTPTRPDFGVDSVSSLASSAADLVMIADDSSSDVRLIDTESESQASEASEPSLPFSSPRRNPARLQALGSPHLSSSSRAPSSLSLDDVESTGLSDVSSLDGEDFEIIEPAGADRSHRHVLLDPLSFHQQHPGGQEVLPDETAAALPSSASLPTAIDTAALDSTLEATVELFRSNHRPSLADSSLTPSGSTYGARPLVGNCSISSDALGASTITPQHSDSAGDSIFEFPDPMSRAFIFERKDTSRKDDEADDQIHRSVEEEELLSDQSAALRNPWTPIPSELKSLPPSVQPGRSEILSNAPTSLKAFAPSDQGRAWKDWKESPSLKAGPGLWGDVRIVRQGSRGETRHFFTEETLTSRDDDDAQPPWLLKTATWLRGATAPSTMSMVSSFTDKPGWIENMAEEPPVESRKQRVFGLKTVLGLTMSAFLLASGCLMFQHGLLWPSNSTEYSGVAPSLSVLASSTTAPYWPSSSKRVIISSSKEVVRPATRVTPQSKPSCARSSPGTASQPPRNQALSVMVPDSKTSLTLYKAFTLTSVFSQHSVSMAPHPSSHLKNAVKGAAFALSELTKAWTLILDDLLQLYNEMLVQLADAVVQLEQSTRPLRKKADIEFKSFGERLKINGKEALIMGRKLGGEALVLGQKLGEDASVIGQKLERSTRPLLEMADRETKMLGEKLKSGGKEALVIGQRLHEDAFSFSQKLGENGKEAICRGRKVAESALGETKKRAYKASKNARKIVDRLYDCKHAKGKKKTKRAAMDEPMSHAKKMWGRAMRAADDRLEYWFFPDEL